MQNVYASVFSLKQLKWIKKCYSPVQIFSDLSASMISSSFSSRVSFDSQIKDNKSNTQSQNTESTTNPTKSERKITKEEVESMKCVRQKRKSSGKKLSHEDCL